MLEKVRVQLFFFLSDCATSEHTQIVLKHTPIGWKLVFCCIKVVVYEYKLP
jgi:hypothetical protein